MDYYDLVFVLDRKLFARYHCAKIVNLEATEWVLFVSCGMDGYEAEPGTRVDLYYPWQHIRRISKAVVFIGCPY